jgi:hypothetical protein
LLIYIYQIYRKMYQIYFKKHKKYLVINKYVK